MFLKESVFVVAVRNQAGAWGSPLVNKITREREKNKRLEKEIWGFIVG